MESLPLQVKLEPQLPGYFLDYEFDTKTGYPLVIIEKEMRIFPRRFDFEDWLSLQSAETFDKSQLCEAVYQYVQKKLQLISLVRDEGNFISEIEHQYQFFCSKTVKDMLFVQEKEVFTKEDVNEIFFKDDAILSQINTLVVKARNYILTHPIYIKHNQDRRSHLASMGDQESWLWCVVNHDACKVEMNLLWMLKFSDGEYEWLDEDLLNHSDWSFMIDNDKTFPQFDIRERLPQKYHQEAFPQI